MEIDTSTPNGHLPYYYMNMGVPNNPAASRPRVAAPEIHTTSSQQPHHPSPMNVNSNSASVVSPVITRRVNALSDANNPSATVSVALANNVVMDASLEQQLEQQLRQLRQQHELQQQFLIEQFQHQQRQLKTQQELQLQQHISEYREQQRLEESRVEQERLEKVELEAIKKKGKHEQSAVASVFVKKELQKVILRRQQKGSVSNISNNSQSNFQNWQPLLGQYDNNYPLQKSASLPNLKSQSSVKQKVLLVNRDSPLLRRRDKAFPNRRKTPLTIDGTGSSTPDSSPNSPPNGVSSLHSRSSSGNTPIQEEPSGSSFGVLSQGNLSDHTLHSSPSLPNISLGKPPGTSSSSGGDNGKVTALSEAQLRAMAAASLGMPLTGHVLPGILPFYPSLPVIESEFTPPTSPAFITQQMKSLEQSRITGNSTSGIVPGLYPGIPITDAQVAQARLHRAGHHRPLSRTQSAPLPLGHPMLQPQVMVITRQQQERYLQERQLYEQQQQHNLLKQTSIPVISKYYEHDLEFEWHQPFNCMSPYKKHIRQTVLTRAGSKNHVENVEEETEAAVALALGDQEVIDLTDKKTNSSDSELHRQQRERETFLQQQRDIMMRHTQTISEEPVSESGKNCKSEIEGYSRHHVVRPLSRAFSSPLVTLSPTGSPQETLSTENIKHIFTTGLAFDTLMLKHQCICGDNSSHPEHHGRLKSIWARLQETGLVAHCEKIPSRKATLEEIQSCHSESYSLLFGTNPLSRQKWDISQLGELPIKNFVALSCGGVGVDSDTTWNDMHTSSAARMAAGCVIDLSLKTASLEIKNGFAVVRPPGHHAEHNQPMGFCFFNSVAIAAKQLRQRLNLDRILIVDWDVHHGNGTQQMFYDDPHVLYISLHRHEEGNFFPGTGGPEEVGVDNGVGFNVNIAWSSFLRPPMGDAEYMAAFRTVVIPIAREFNPEMVLVSCGFDGAAGHPDPLGGYKLSPSCFGHMTRQLMQLAGGRVVLSLEGGYDLQAICDCAEQCVKALLGDELAPLSEKEVIRKPCQAAIDTLQKTLAIQAPHWPCIKRWGHMVGMSVIEAQQKEKEESETVSALASLSMVHGNRSVIDCGIFATQNGNAVSVVTSAPSTATNTATMSSQHNESGPSSLRSSPDHGSPIEVEEPMEQEDTDTK